MSSAMEAREKTALPVSPLSQMLDQLGMTRDDLEIHRRRMADFLAADAKNPAVEPSSDDTPTQHILDFRGRSRHKSRSNVSSASPSPTPSRAALHRDSSDGSLSRPKDIMEMVIEHHGWVAKQKKTASAARSRDNGRVSSALPLTPTRPSTPENAPQTPHHHKYYSERVLGASASRKTPTLETPIKNRSKFKIPSLPIPFTHTETPSRDRTLASRAASPCSSPARFVNIVSSPGPMRPAPLQTPIAEELPFTLPPGPYSSEKPELSYAAIIGQAILASPNHRLTLQDIYEYITTVHPWYTRGEQTWMNSVRHALSTMLVFHKVPRDRSEGKSLWAIFDEDLPAFEGGGFKKALLSAGSGQPTKGRKRTASTLEEGGSKPKRRKKGDPPQEHPIHPLPPMIPAPMLPYYSFPQTNPHHQPYYAPLPEGNTVPADLLFPPLPPSSNIHRLTAHARSRSTTSEAGSSTMGGGYESDDSFLPPSSPQPSSPQLSRASSSVPDLTPTLSSSSNPSSQDLLRSRSGSPLFVESLILPSYTDDEDEVLTAGSSDWLGSDSIDPSELLPTKSKKKGKRKAKAESPPRVSEEPLTLDEDFSDADFAEQYLNEDAVAEVAAVIFPLIAPQCGRPSTPPPKAADKADPSPFKTPRTPQKGVNKEYPETSYGSRAPLLFGQIPDADQAGAPTSPTVLPKTPSRAGAGRPRNASGPFTTPRTPRMLAQESPGALLHSPSLSIFNSHSHDPYALEDELSTLFASPGVSYGDSPGGMLGRRSLYESPGMPSPRRWDKLW